MNEITGGINFANLHSTLFPTMVIQFVHAVHKYEDLSTITIPSTAIRPRDYAKELLDRIRHLKNEYVVSFGPGSRPPKSQAFLDAEAFIRKLPLNRMTLPMINIASDGEVNFDWSRDDCRIDLGFFGNGKYSFYGRRGNSEILGDDVSVTEELPAELVEIAA